MHYIRMSSRDFSGVMVGMTAGKILLPLLVCSNVAVKPGCIVTSINGRDPGQPSIIALSRQAISSSIQSSHRPSSRLYLHLSQRLIRKLL